MCGQGVLYCVIGNSDFQLYWSFLCLGACLEFGVVLCKLIWVFVQGFVVHMKSFSWNCRGICNASIVRSFKDHIRMVHPNVIFLGETKASEERMLKVIKSLRVLSSLTI